MTQLPLNPTTSVRAGVIGAGIGSVHIDALRRVGVEVVALGASTEARAREHADRLGVPHACASVEELLATGVDVVHVCTPNALHAEQVMEVAAAGRHVISEKPLGVSVEECERMLEAVEQARVLHAVAYTYRYYPMVQRMRQYIASGALGRIHLVRGAYLNDETLRIHSGHWMLDPAKVGPALILADTGVHWWDLVEYVTGARIREVMCVRQVVRDPAAAGEDSSAVLMRLDDDLVASAVVSGAAAGRDNTIELELIGTESCLRWDQEDPDTLWRFALGAPASRIRRDGSEKVAAAIPTLRLPTGHIEGYLEAFRDLVAHIYSSLSRTGDEPAAYPTFDDGLRGVRVLDALLRSSSTGQWASV